MNHDFSKLHRWDLVIRIEMKMKMMKNQTCLLPGFYELVCENTRRKILMQQIQKKVDRVNALLAKLDKKWEVKYSLR
jgi:hypothetical protein